MSISVEADFNRQGEALPRRVIWQGQALSVLGIGRRWQDEAGQHILVQTAGGHSFELRYNGAGWEGRHISSNNAI